MELLPVVVPGQSIFYLLIDEARDRWIAPFLRDHRLWEPAETALCLRLIQPGSTVVDVGAHVGYFTILSSRLCGKSGRVIAFEPEPANYRLLRANLLVNDCNNVDAQPLALSDKRGSANLFLSLDNSGDHRLEFGQGRARIDIETVAFDDYFADGHVDFVKMDAQGAEPRVLGGMHKLIARERDHLCLLMEFSPGLIGNATGVAALAALLESFGARASVISMSNDGGKQQIGLHRANTTTELLAESSARLARISAADDASENLLVFFSEAAENRCMARLA